MEAANREERRLMRQRGAGTRKIQEVDFGFSFGPPAAAPPAPPPPPPNRSPQQPEPNSSASRGSLRPDLTPETQQPLAPPQSDRRSSQAKLQSPTTRLSSARRSPVSSRNGHTSSSIYDIPPDSPQEPSSSAKRRRIGPSPKDGSIQAIPENEPVQTNGVGLHETQNTEPAEQVQSPEIQKAASLPEATKSPQQAITQRPQLNEPSSSLPSINKNEPDITRQEGTPINNAEEETRAPDTQPDLAESSSKPQEGKASKKPRKRKSIIWKRKPRRSSDEINKQGNKAQAQQAPEPEPERELERVPEPELPEPPEPEQEQEQESEPELPEQPQLSSARRRRKSKSIDEQPEEQEAEPAAAVEEREGSGAPEDAPELDGATSRVPEKKEPKRKKRQSVLPKKQKRKAARQPSIEQPPEDEDEPDHEVEEVEQGRPDKSTPEEPDPGPSREARNKRKSTKKDTTRASRALETAQEEQEAQVDNENRRSAAPQQAASRKKARKPRRANSETESRKGSFPVTVHRLANVSALEAVPEPDRTQNEADSSDELAARQKFPSRGGVNPVDVLSQICRETLAKTLSALENGIANETQNARRAEFTRKRKAVEAFGEELEGRLFDMTEVLDSNFSLAMGLRGARKEMRESRSKLMDIRRQREEIALKMDEVRRKHLEEEKMQTQHNNVNNSLHNLELAIDRGQSHTESEDRSNPAAGLEFLLRSVADDVSSTSPGSQGGLLNQIKNFNARLEERVNRG